MISILMFTSVTFTNLILSLHTIFSLWPANALALFSGVRLAQANHEELGTKLLSKLILRTQELNFGVVTRVKTLSLLTNFVVVSILPIFYDGLIATQFELKLKEDPDL